LILLAQPVVHAAETAQSGSSIGAALRPYQVKECARRYQEANCTDFFKENPELGQYAVDCNNPIDIAKELKACGEGGLRAAVDIKDLLGTVISGIASIPGALAAGPGEKQRALDLYFGECVKSMECKIQAYKGAAGYEPNENARRALERMTDGGKLQNLVYHAENQTLLRNRQRAVSILRTQPEGPERDRQMNEIYPGWSERKDHRTQSLWEMSLNAGKHVLKAANCFKGEIQAEAACHGLATILIPGTVIKAGSKLAHIASVVGRSLRAENVLARSLNAAERRAVQLAHEEKDLGEKANILRRAGFNEAERRKIIEAGIAGNVESATASSLNEARLNLGVLEYEQLVASRQIQHLKRRLAACETKNEACDGIVSAIRKEYETALAEVRHMAAELEKRLAAKIEAGDESEELMKRWIAVADCAKTERPIKCNEIFVSAQRVLGDISPAAAAAPVARVQTPYQAMQKLDFLDEARRRELQGMLASANNHNAAARVAERVVVAQRAEYTQVDNFSRAVESVIGRGATPGKAPSKAYLESADGNRRIIFDPAQRYFTVQERGTNNNWFYRQMVVEADGSLRLATAAERGGSGHLEWVRLTHFSY
jgi:hypothetical protein